MNIKQMNYLLRKNMDKIVFVVVSVLLVFLTSLYIVMDKAEKKEWESFAKNHDCKIVSKEKGVTSLSPIMSNNGSMLFMVSKDHDKTGYLCNDGITYYR